MVRNPIQYELDPAKYLVSPSMVKLTPLALGKSVAVVAALVVVVVETGGGVVVVVVLVVVARVVPPEDPGSRG